MTWWLWIPIGLVAWVILSYPLARLLGRAIYEHQRRPEEDR